MGVGPPVDAAPGRNTSEGSPGKQPTLVTVPLTEEGHRLARDHVFANLWAVYPRKVGKADAYKAVVARIRAGVHPDDLHAATLAYARLRAGEDPSFTMHPKTFFGSSERFRDYLPGGAGLITASARRSRAELELDIDRTVDEVQNIFNLPPDERDGIAKGPLIVALLERYSYQQLGRMSIQEIRNVIAAMVFTPKGETA